MKIFGIRQTRRNFKIILVMTTAGGGAGAAQSCPVSSYLNYEFWIGRRLQTTLYAHSTARLVFSSRLGKVCVYLLTALFSLFMQIVFTWLHPSLCTCKKPKQQTTQKKKPSPLPCPPKTHTFYSTA